MSLGSIKEHPGSPGIRQRSVKNTYVALVNWTDKGVQEVQESPARIQKAKAAIAAAGGEVKSVYVTLGRCDMIAVIEAPDDAAYTRVMLNLASKGGVRTESLRAFPEDEFRDIGSAGEESIVLSGGGTTVKTRQFVWTQAARAKSMRDKTAVRLEQ